MTILPSPPPGWKRPGLPPLGVQVKVLLRMLGLSKVEWDHRPPLSERKFDTETGDTVPPANDPEFIEAIGPQEHDRRTNGPGGEKRITTLGSDSHSRAKTRSVRRAEAEHQDAIARKAGLADTFSLPALTPHQMFPKSLAAIEQGIAEAVALELQRRPHPKAKIASRGFDKTRTKTFSGKVKLRKKVRRA